VNGFDTKRVDMITALGNSSVRAFSAGPRKDKKIYHHEYWFAGSTALTEEQCSPYWISLCYDTMPCSRHSHCRWLKNGGKKMVLYHADFAFGHSLRDNTGR